MVIPEEIANCSGISQSKYFKSQKLKKNKNKNTPTKYIKEYYIGTGNISMENTTIFRKQNNLQE